MKQVKLFKDCCGTDLEDEVNEFCKKHNVIDVKMAINHRHLSDIVIIVVYEVEKCQQ